MSFRFCLFFLAIFFSNLFPLSGQTGNCLILGTLRNANDSYFTVRIDKSYIDNTIEENELYIRPDDGRFGLLFNLEFPQLVTLSYKGKSVDVFMAPNDSLVLQIDAQLFPYGIRFEGRGAANNNCWRNYKESFPVDKEEFKYLQYRKGVYYYKVHEEEDKLMRAKQPNDYVAELRRQFLQKESMLQQYNQGDKSNLTTDFLDFMYGELEGDLRFKQLAYGDVYRGRHRLDSSYFSFFDTLSVFRENALGNASYRQFLEAWLNYRCHQIALPDSVEHVYEQQYYFAKAKLKGLLGYFAMANVLNKGFQKEDPQKMLKIYEDFLTTNPYMELDRLVTDAFQRTRQFAAGSPAPTFVLTDLNGNPVSLRDYQGKVVYLSFWATWCRPCMNKMQELLEVEQAFEGKNVVFLHVSLDQNKSVWRKTIQEKRFGGIHLYGHNNLEMTTKYQVLSVPKFFLITKEGNFAFTPSSSDVSVLANTIEKLLR